MGEPPGPKRKEPPGINVEVTMYSCLLLDFHLTGDLPRIFIGVPYCGALLEHLFSVSIPQDLEKYLVHQAEPLYLARLKTTWRSPGIPDGAVEDRLTHCHSSLRHSTDTVGLGIVFQGLLLSIRSVLRNRVTTRRTWLFNARRRSWVERGYNPHLPPLENS